MVETKELRDKQRADFNKLQRLLNREEKISRTNSNKIS